MAISRRTVGAWFAALLCLIPLLAATPAEAAAHGRVLVVGDSISQGLEGDFTWRYRLAQHLAAVGQSVDFVGPWAGTHVIPAALPAEGQTLPAVHTGAYRPGISFDSANLAQWGWQMNKAKAVIEAETFAANPDYLLLELGFNDLGWFVSDANGLWTDLGAFLAGVDRAAARRGHQIKVAVGTVPQRSPIEGRADLPVAIDAYNAKVRSSLGALGANYANLSLAVADIAARYDWRVDSYDDLHPGVRGEYVIADVYADTLAAAWSFGAAASYPPATVDAPINLAFPAAVTVTPITEGLRISWSHVFGAGGYLLYQRNVSAGETTFTQLPLPIGADSWTSRPLPAGMRAEYQVRAVKGNLRANTPSSVATGTVGGSPPGVVPRVEVSNIAENSAKISWTPASGADSYAIHETYLRTWVQNKLPWNIAGPTFTAGLLTSGTWYKYTVVPYNGYLSAGGTSTVGFRTTGIGTREVVAMGDSYASGLGADAYDADPDNTGCKRSAYAWGRQILGSFIARRWLLACAGRLIHQVKADQVPVLAGLPNASPRLVTVVAGGNDVEWFQILLECAAGDCTDQRGRAESNIDNIEDNLVDLYKAIKAASPASDVVAGGYPIILEPGASGCGQLYFSNAERDMVRDLTIRMNNMIERAAREAGVISAAQQVEDEFRGHGVCNGNTADPANQEWLHQWVLDTNVVESFHPNRRGQVGYATAFLNAFQSYAAQPHTTDE
ncbi:GDSL-type esterase/lipase family protein [Actinoplanes sp. NPDC048988]|uniref:GDSL-type esterase/lipase family protein n=1 Tax=Actinoplanes sp. NPDC048988 TaxID=3363901 RepID=UPI00371B2692